MSVSAFPVISQACIGIPAAEGLRVESGSHEFPHCGRFEMVFPFKSVKDLQICPRSAAVFRRARAFAVDADWIRNIRLGRENPFDSNVVDPAVAEVVLVQESVVRLERKAPEPDFLRIVREIRPPGVADSVLSSVDMKAVQVDVLPSHGNLDDVVKIRDVRLPWHQKTTPDHGTDATQ